MPSSLLFFTLVRGDGEGAPLASLCPRSLRLGALLVVVFWPDVQWTP